MFPAVEFIEPHGERKWGGGKEEAETRPSRPQESHGLIEGLSQGCRLIEDDRAFVAIGKAGSCDT